MTEVAGETLPLARQGHARGRLARRLRRGAARRAEGARAARATRTRAREQELPPLEEGEKVRCTEVAADARETKPPPRYGEAALLAAMEGAGKLDRGRRAARGHEGLGHRHAGDARRHHRAPASTSATSCATAAACMPTGKGIQVIDLLGEHELTSPSLTGRLGAPPARHRARAAAAATAFMRDIAQFTEQDGRLPARPPARGDCASSGATSTSSARAAASGHLIENAQGLRLLDLEVGRGAPAAAS